MDMNQMSDRNWVYVPYDGGVRKAYKVDSKWQEDDGAEYYRLDCSYWFGDWIETLPTTMWKSYGARHRAIYIVNEDTWLLIKLKWS